MLKLSKMKKKYVLPVWGSWVVKQWGGDTESHLDRGEM